jgi:hypothetical protein
VAFAYLIKMESFMFYVKNGGRAVLMVLLLSLVGCASVQKPVSFNAVPDEKRSIGIVQVEAPDAAAAYTGSIGLLDLAIISAANGGLNKHLKAQKFTADYQELPKDLKKILEAKGYKTVLIEKPISLKAAAKFKSPKNGVNTNDFSKYKQDHGITDILIVSLFSVGTTRSYYGPVPLTEPAAQAVIRGMLVNLDNNKLEWFSTATSSKTIEKPWDESAKNWPNLTNAVYVAMNEATKLVKTEVENPQLVNKETALK